MVIRKILTASLISGMLFSPLVADRLKNSLSNVLKHKDTTPLVDLSGLDINAKTNSTQYMKPVTRSSNAIVANVNGKDIVKSKLDKFLYKVSNKKIKDFDLLQPKQQIMLIKQYYLPHYIASLAIQDIPKDQRYELYRSIWMRKKTSQINISEEDMQKTYQTMLENAQLNHQEQLIPPYDNIKDKIKIQLLDDAIKKYVLKDATIELSEPNPMGIVGSINGEFVSLSEVEPIVKQITRGQASWNMLNPIDKRRILEMIATKKLSVSIAVDELSLEEKYNAISNIWLQKKIRDISVSDDELVSAYKEFKKRYKQGNPPSFEDIKQNLKLEVARDKYIKQIMKNMKIKLK